MRYEMRPTREICYYGGNAIENYELCFEEVEEKEAHVFSVYEREPDGCLRWIADF
jgi:hypothetical protein